MPDPLPRSAEIERIYLERARRLPAAAQRLLLLVAADDTGSLATVSRAAATLGIEPERTRARRRLAGLVRAFDGARRVRHPLVRSTLYGDATFAQRQAVHRALADVLDAEQDADRRAWHRAAASLGEDDEVADELEQRHGGRRRRSGFAAAGRALERAAELSSDDEARGRRLVAAAQRCVARRRPRAGARAARPRPRPRLRPGVRAEEMHLRGTIELRCGIPAEAATILAAGAAEIAAIAPAKAIEMLARGGDRLPPTPATFRRPSSSVGARRRLSGDDDPDSGSRST